MESDERRALAFLVIVAGITLYLMIKCVDKIAFAEMYLHDVTRFLHREHDQKHAEAADKKVSE